MAELNLNNGEFIISKTDDTDIAEFLKKGVANFFKELSQYINDNDDKGIIHYATERTLASLFVCGNLKRDENMTGLQEYGTLCTRDNKEVNGRPDIFIKSGKKAIWIECKYDRNTQKVGDDHWDIPGWLLWDTQNAFSQVEIYYNSESKNLNSSYSKRYIVTLCFKLIKENRQAHERKVEAELRAKANDKYERVWYYQVGFFSETDSETGKNLGMEVYGTCSEDLAKGII